MQGMNKGSRDWMLLGMLGVFLFVMSTQPIGARFCWARLHTAPDIEACRRQVRESGIPILAGLADGLLDRAEASEAAAVAGTIARAPRDEATAHLIRAHRTTVLAFLVLYGPIFLGWSLALSALVQGVRWLRPRRVDLRDELVILDVRDVAIRTVDVKRKKLPTTVSGLAELRAMRPDVRARFDAWMSEVDELIRERKDAGISDEGRVMAECLTRRGYSGHLASEFPRVRRLVRSAKVPVELLETREALSDRKLLTPLHLALLEILAAHESHPASIEHHSPEEGGLIRHTAGVVRAGLALIDAGEVRPEDIAAFVTLLLGHDIGKTASYAKIERIWYALDRLHAQNGALILQSLPELQQTHVAGDVHRLLLSVGHQHDQEAIPLEDTTSCRRLLTPLHLAEGKSIADELESASPQLRREAAEYVRVHMVDLIQGLNINRAMGGRKPDGMFATGRSAADDILLILEAKLRDDLVAYLPPRYRRALGLSFRRVSGRVHPAWAEIGKVLVEDGAVPSTVRGTSIDPETLLLSVLVGKTIFRGAFPLDVEWLLKQGMPRDALDALRARWAIREDFPVKALASGTSLEAVAELKNIRRSMSDAPPRSRKGKTEPRAEDKPAPLAEEEGEAA